MTQPHFSVCGIHPSEILQYNYKREILIYITLLDFPAFMKQPFHLRTFSGTEEGCSWSIEQYLAINFIISEEPTIENEADPDLKSKTAEIGMNI